MSRHLTQENRQRMQPWLESRINSQDIEGLEWIDKEKKMFKVPWKHVGNREWSERDGIIFREWAVHTGKYREGIDSPDWPTWKTRFRCALTKLPGILELKHLNKLDGQTDEPYRVYQFVPKKSQGGESASFSPRFDMQFLEDSDSNSQHSAMDFSQPFSSPNQTLCVSQGPRCLDLDLNLLPGQTNKYEVPAISGPTIPTTVMSETDIDMADRLPSDIQSMDSGDLIKLDSADIRNLSLESGGESFKMHADRADFIEQIAKKPLPGQNNNPLTLEEVIKSATLDINDKKICLSIKYLGVTKCEELCDNPVGCRIFFSKPVNLNQEDFEHMFGPIEAKSILLPNCDMQNSHQQTLTLNLLNATDRGILITVKNGNIYATRKCRCRIYVSRPTLENKCEILKLERDVETLVYDLMNYFKPAVERYIYQNGPKPVTDVVVGFGQNFSMERESLNNLLVSAEVIHLQAHNLLSHILSANPNVQEIEQSESTPTDHILEVIQYTQEP